MNDVRANIKIKKKRNKLVVSSALLGSWSWRGGRKEKGGAEEEEDGEEEWGWEEYEGGGRGLKLFAVGGGVSLGLVLHVLQRLFVWFFTCYTKQQQKGFH